MDRDQLKQWLDEGLSLPQIGELAGRHPSTVGYWVRKHGLVANGKAKYAPRGGLTRAQLEPLVQRGATLQEMAESLDRSTSTVRHWLRVFGLRSSRHHRRRSRAIAAREAGLTRFGGICRRHGETEFLALPGGRSRCARCNGEAVAARRRKVKRILVEEAGGQCALCGYGRCVAALEFHHVDPGLKAFGLADRGMTRALDEAREEARKCVLLCANCHAEVESGMTVLPCVAKLATPLASSGLLQAPE
jgi:transposase